MFRSAFLLITLTLLSAPAPAADTLVFHYPDSGAPPWLYLSPGDHRPVGLVADIVEAAARQAGREVRYDFRPRESANEALRSGSAGGAMFFGVTRPAARDVLVSEAILRMDTVLVTVDTRPVNYARPLDLQNRRLCTLTDEVYPPLTLLAMNSSLLQRKAKTEQAQLMMLRNEDCVAAVLNGPMYHWLSAKYRWTDLRSEKQPLLSDSLLLGFAADEAAMLANVDSVVKKLRLNGGLERQLARHLPGAGHVGMR